VQLKRRYDFFIQIGKYVKAMLPFERVWKSAQARARQCKQYPGQKARLKHALGHAKSLFAYPRRIRNWAQHKFLELQRELSDTENKIQAARRFYNGNVRDFNTKLQCFPQIWLRNV